MTRKGNLSAGRYAEIEAYGKKVKRQEEKEKQEAKTKPEPAAKPSKLLKVFSIEFTPAAFVVRANGRIGTEAVESETYRPSKNSSNAFLEIIPHTKRFIGLEKLAHNQYLDLVEYNTLGVQYTTVPYKGDEKNTYSIRVLGSLEEVVKTLENFAKNDEMILDLTVGWDDIIMDAKKDRQTALAWAKERSKEKKGELVEEKKRSEKLEKDLAQAKKDNTWGARLIRAFSFASKKDSATPATAKANDDTKPQGQQSPNAIKPSGNGSTFNG